MKPKIFILTIILMAAFNTSAQEVFDLKGSGARAAGMGYAFIGVADDATAMTWNPAGLTQLGKPELSVVGNYTFNDKLKYDYYDTDHNFEDKMKNQFSLNYASLVIPVKIGEGKLILGAAFQNYINYKWQYESGSDYDNDYYEIRYNKTLINNLSFTAAVKMNPILSIGATAHTYFSTGNEYGGTYYHNPEKNSLNKQDSYSGFNFTLGALVDFSQKFSNFPLRIGIRTQTPFELKTTIKPQVYQYGNVDNWYEVPLMLGTGVSYRFGNDFTLSMDYEIRNFKDKYEYWEGTVYDYRYPDDPKVYNKEEDKMLISEANKNLNQIRVGAEYIFHPGKILVPLRLGYRQVPTCNANTDEYGESSDQVIANTFHFGSGVAFPQLMSLDLAFEAFEYSQEDKTSNSTIYSSTNLLTFSLIFYLGR